MKITEEIAGSPVTKIRGLKAAASTVGTTDAASRALLLHWVRARTTPQRVVLRSRIVLSALDGLAADQIAAVVRVSPTTVRLWTARFEEGGPDALLRDAPGRGRPPLIEPGAMHERLRAANLVREDGLPTSIRRAARFLGVSASAVWRALARRRTSA
jgi:transposase